jgi:hypothetical protein
VVNSYFKNGSKANKKLTWTVIVKRQCCIDDVLLDTFVHTFHVSTLLTPAQPLLLVDHKVKLGLHHPISI